MLKLNIYLLESKSDFCLCEQHLRNISESLCVIGFDLVTSRIQRAGGGDAAGAECAAGVGGAVRGGGAGGTRGAGGGGAVCETPQLVLGVTRWQEYPICFHWCRSE